MSRREPTPPPSQQAINGALDLYVDGGKKDDVQQMLVGLAVLRHATETQIHAAVTVVRENRKLAEGEIQRMLATYGDTPAAPQLRAAAGTSTAAERSWDNEGGSQLAPAISAAPNLAPALS